MSTLITKEDPVNNILYLIFLGGERFKNPNMIWPYFLLIIVVMYFLMIRPQTKKQKNHRETLAALEKGDKIISSGGIVGTIVGVKETENMLIIKIADNVKIELSRNAVAQVLRKRSS